MASGICELSAEGLLFFFGSASLSFKMDENQAEELRLWQTLAQNEKKGASHISQRQFWHSLIRMGNAATTHCSRHPAHPPTQCGWRVEFVNFRLKAFCFSLVLPHYLSRWMRIRQKNFVCGKHWHKMRKKERAIYIYIYYTSTSDPSRRSKLWRETLQILFLIHRSTIDQT